MLVLLRQVAAATAFVGVVFSLAACGDDESTQRKAFMEFLQTRIIDKPGLHVPQLNDELAHSFGPYAKQYAVITGFNADMDQSVVGALPKAMRAAQVASIADVVDKRAEIASAHDAVSKIRSALNDRLAAAETARAALVQPEDLKVVYDAAFDRTVRSPANALKNALPSAESALQSLLVLIDYLNSHRDQVAVQGVNISASDAKVRSDVSAMLDDINRKNRQLLESQSQLNKLMSGG
jgi:hypothetical protein